MKKSESLKSNNKGLSLLEIVIVVAIMTVIGAVTVLATSVATDKHVMSCAEKICSSFEQTRNLAMGKRTARVEISQAVGDYVYLQMYVDDNTYGERVVVGRPGITVNLYDKDGNLINDLPSAGTLKVYFSRSNGSITTNPSSVEKIGISNGRRTIYITMDSFTGRISTENG